MNSNSRKAAEQFIKKYSWPRFIRLIELFKKSTSGPEIAQEFGVTRQRIAQWRSAFGSYKSTFVLNPDIEKLVTTGIQGRTII